MEKPYITPDKILSGKQLPYDCKTAFVCYCPYPEIFDEYLIKIAKERYFISSPISEVKFCKFNDTNFIVISEVYGGPVSATTVEELSYYGIELIIGIGFVGGLYQGEIGQNFYLEKSLAESGTTPYYSDQEFCYPSESLVRTFQKFIGWTTNALYREYSSEVKLAVEKGCQVVNMDTSHLYAACEKLKIKCIYYGTITDIIEEENWNDSLKGVMDKHDFTTVLDSQKQLIQFTLDTYLTHWTSWGDELI